MNYRIVIEDGIIHITATLSLDEIERFRSALQLARQALEILEEHKVQFATIKPGHG